MYGLATVTHLQKRAQQTSLQRVAEPAYLALGFSCEGLLDFFLCLLLSLFCACATPVQAVSFQDEHTNKMQQSGECTAGVGGLG